MIVNVVTHHTNGAGLQKDSDLLSRLLQARGHVVHKLQFDDPRIKGASAPVHYRAQVSFFLEVVTPQALAFAPVNVLIPNSEWWSDPAWGAYLGKFRMVLCKTPDCLRIWQRKVGPQKCRYIGWEAPDRYDANVERQYKFFHAAGKSQTKNTAAVMQAWRDYKLPYPITVSAFKPEIKAQCTGIPNVTLIDRFPEEEMNRVMNEHLFHLMPSKYEGYGMAIHEALSCGAMVLTTNAAPMNTFAGVSKDLLIPVERVQACRLAQFNLVSGKAVAEVVRRAWEMTDEELTAKFHAARQGYLQDRSYFQEEFPKSMVSLGL